MELEKIISSEDIDIARFEAQHKHPNFNYDDILYDWFDSYLKFKYNKQYHHRYTNS